MIRSEFLAKKITFWKTAVYGMVGAQVDNLQQLTAMLKFKHAIVVYVMGWRRGLALRFVFSKNQQANE